MAGVGLCTSGAYISITGYGINKATYVPRRPAVFELCLFVVTHGGRDVLSMLDMLDMLDMLKSR